MLKSLSILIISLIFCIPVFAEDIQAKFDKQSIYFKTDQKRWKIASQQDAGNKGVVVYVSGDETIDAWSELVTINYFKGMKGEDLVKRLTEFTKKGLESQCAKISWNILSISSENALYQWSAQACVGVPDQSELARVLVAGDTLYVLHYANKKVPMPESSFRAWKKNLEESFVKG